MVRIKDFCFVLSFLFVAKFVLGSFDYDGVAVVVRTELVVTASFLVEDGANKNGGAVKVGLVGFERVIPLSPVPRSVLPYHDFPSPFALDLPGCSSNLNL